MFAAKLKQPAALRLNIPVIFVSGGPMEAGKTKLSEHKLDLVDAMVIAGILGELDRAGLINTSLPTVDSKTMAEALETWGIMRSLTPEVVEFYKAGPAGIPTQQAFSQSTRWPSPDGDRVIGCIRSAEHAYSAEGAWRCFMATLRWTDV